MKRVVAPLVLLPLLHGVAASPPAGVPDHTVPPGANYDKAEFRSNKGGIYYSALVPRAARAVPALLFVGDKDPAFRTSTIAGLFAVNRRAGALWALAIEPDTAHAVGRSRDLGAMFFADAMALRLASGALTPVDASDGFIGDLTAATIQPAAGAAAPAVPTAWLPTERLARAWQAVVTGRPFGP